MRPMAAAHNTQMRKTCVYVEDTGEFEWHDFGQDWHGEDKEDDVIDLTSD